MQGWAWVRVGALVGFLGVAVGAFGAHGLKTRLEGLGTSAAFQTGVQYHLAHALALVALGSLAPFRPGAAAGVAGWCFLFGVIVFSGSLYALGVTGVRAWGAVTPIGGVLFLVGWLALAVAAGPPQPPREASLGTPGAADVAAGGRP